MWKNAIYEYIKSRQRLVDDDDDRERTRKVSQDMRKSWEESYI